MITIKLEQGSKEWNEVRLKHFTASEAPAMMNDSKYMSRNELLKLKKTGKSKPITDFQQRLFDKGHAAEASARPIIEEIIGEDLYPVTGVLEDSKFLASFDGLTALRDIDFEHKLWNEALAENVRNNVLEPHYYWQLEQQLLVSGAKKAIFVTSDGTEAKMERMEYLSKPERREALIAGWAQFEKDLADYQVEVVKEVTIAAEVQSFPLIIYQVTGTEISSNIVDCLDIITQRSQFEMTRVLETDQDFADKDQLNKATIKARASLKTMLKEVEGKFVSYSEFATVAAQIDSVMQKMQTHGEKQVKQAKADKKRAIENQGLSEISAHISEINLAINPIVLSSLMNCEINITVAMKGKRTIESLQNAVDEVVAHFKIDSNNICERVKVNLTTLREMAGDYKFLFTDTPQLVIKDNEDLVAVIKTRIADHKQAEEKKLEDERKKIREEEEVRQVEISNYIDKLKLLPAEFGEKSSTQINAEIVTLSRLMITKEEFGGRSSEVNTALDVVVSQLEALKTNAEKIEDVEKSENEQRANNLETANRSTRQAMKIKEESLNPALECAQQTRKAVEEIKEEESQKDVVDDIPIEQTPEKTLNNEIKKQDAKNALKEVIKGFLEFSATSESAVNDFGNLLCVDDPTLNAEALENIRNNFSLYMRD